MLFEAHADDRTRADVREKFLLWRISALYDRRRGDLDAGPLATPEERSFLHLVLEFLSLKETQEDRIYAFDAEAQKFVSQYPGSERASLVSTYLRKDIRSFAVKMRFGGGAVFGGKEVGATEGPHPGFDLGCQITVPEPNLSFVVSFGDHFFGSMGQDTAVGGQTFSSGHALLFDDLSLQVGYPLYFPVATVVPLAGLSLITLQDMPGGQGQGATVYTLNTTLALEVNGLDPKVQVLDAPNFFEVSLMGGVYLPTNTSNAVVGAIRPFVKVTLSLGPRYVVRVSRAPSP